MPDFNKGDFTQQGVNGHVNATVRLNEKRLVSIDMTSDEEAEGCTITGTVKDLLNDKVYGIGSGGGGGETATVNFINIAADTTYSILLPVISAEGVTLINEDVEGNENNFTIPINNGSFAISFSYLENANPEVMPTVTGDIQLDFENGLIIITGDGTFTAAGGGE